MRSEFSGTGVALATPLLRDLSIDFESLKKLIEHILSGQVDYLVVQGTTGESPVFSWEEKLNLLRFVLEENKGRVPVVFGLGGNNTLDLIKKSKDLSDFDIAAFLSVSPYYSRPSQDGIIRHYTMLADAFPKPVILYNVPTRTASNVEAETTLRLAEHANIIAMKEASGNLIQCEQILKNKPEGFMLVSGDDQMTLNLIEKGADGVISVVANILPEIFTQMVNAALAGDTKAAGVVNQRLTPVYKLLSEEGNPSSLKTGLSELNICLNTVRPPLFEGSDSLKMKWKELLTAFKA
ncbi:MAG: 4-hydroxy-tetrahydrodipicolinate synthase [Cyclobacteriaceae bacterium]